MSDLWESRRKQAVSSVAPLAMRMRPRSLDMFVGQDHLLGEGKLLRRMIDADQVTSVIFYGPPGTGKTTLAEVIAHHTKRHFERGHAAAIGVKDVRRICDEARQRIENHGTRTVLFLDEIHRFNKAQQDVLLRDVERGVLTLIGATTENPYFAINAALVSRSTIFRFEPLTESDIQRIITMALADADHGFGALEVEITEEAIRHWAVSSDGDARRALGALEVAIASSRPDPEAALVIDLNLASESIQKKAIVYDGTGDQHYDTISAFIKSMRGSDADATVYWLALMLEAGEDPRFIARRISILASEDIGNADPNAIQVAAAAWALTERVGMPECQLTLAQAAIYMALAPKSNASARAIWQAVQDVRNGRTVEIPPAIRDAHYGGAKSLGHGDNYAYAHNAPGGVVPGQDMGIDRLYYQPTDRGFEARLRERIEQIRQVHRKNSQDNPS